MLKFMHDLNSRRCDYRLHLYLPYRRLHAYCVYLRPSKRCHSKGSNKIKRFGLRETQQLGWPMPVLFMYQYVIFTSLKAVGDVDHRNVLH
jgi:hypothetical protein